MTVEAKKINIQTLKKNSLTSIQKKHESMISKTEKERNKKKIFNERNTKTNINHFSLFN